MTSRTPTKLRTAPQGETRRIYLKMLDALYERVDMADARRVAKEVEAHLAAYPDVRASIRGDELRSLVAEARGKLDAAIRYRESEIRKIFELHSLAINKPGWDYVLERYGYSDLADRLDLLAILYSDDGDLDRAAEVLEESRLFCRGHGVRFDGQDIVDDIAALRAKRDARSRSRRKKTA